MDFYNILLAKSLAGNGGGAGGDSNNGYYEDIETKWYFEQQTFTPTDDHGLYIATLTIADSDLLDDLPQTLYVTFDRTDYVCPLIDGMGYGASYDESTESMDFSTYPFSIGGPSVAVEDANQHTISAYYKESSLIIDDTFKRAVQGSFPEVTLSDDGMVWGVDQKQWGMISPTGIKHMVYPVLVEGTEIANGIQRETITINLSTAIPTGYTSIIGVLSGTGGANFSSYSNWSISGNILTVYTTFTNSGSAPVSLNSYNLTILYV